MVFLKDNDNVLKKFRNSCLTVLIVVEVLCYVGLSYHGAKQRYK